MTVCTALLGETTHTKERGNVAHVLQMLAACACTPHKKNLRCNRTHHLTALALDLLSRGTAAAYTFQKKYRIFSGMVEIELFHDSHQRDKETVVESDYSRELLIKRVNGN